MHDNLPAWSLYACSTSLTRLTCGDATHALFAVSLHIGMPSTAWSCVMGLSLTPLLVKREPSHSLMHASCPRHACTSHQSDASHIICMTPHLKASSLLLQMNQSKGAEGMLETRQAYEYALDRIGLDVQSGGLWQEYINFLQLPRPNTPAYRTLWAAGSAPGQEDSQRVMTLRSVSCVSAATWHVSNADTQQVYSRLICKELPGLSVCS